MAGQKKATGGEPVARSSEAEGLSLGTHLHSNTIAAGGGGESDAGVPQICSCKFEAPGARLKKDARALEFRHQDALLEEARQARELRELEKVDLVKEIMGYATWRSFISLTVDSKRHPDMTHQVLMWLWRQLVAELNVAVWGKHYQRVIGHSYFGYVVIEEQQVRGELHLHALVDERFDWGLLHRWWEAACGFAWITPVRNQEEAVRYLCKYITKGRTTEPEFFRCAYPDKEPAYKPLWWTAGP